MAVTPKSRDIPAQHDEQMQRFADACTACGLTFAVRDNSIPNITAVSLRLLNQRSPDIYGVITPYGFSLNLQDLTRITGPEKTKLRDVFTYLTRV